MPVAVSLHLVICQEDLNPTGLTGLDERRHIYRRGFQSRLRDGISEPPVEGGQVARVSGPIGVARLCAGSGQHLHAFLMHKGVVGTLDLPMHAVVPWCLARHGVVVQDGDVCVDTTAFAVVVDDDHGGAIGVHLFRQQEPEISGSLQVGGIVYIQFVGVERQHI